MSRSLPRRSLAVSAVGALAVTGLALSPQPAGAAAPGVMLLSQPDGIASVRYDGNDYALQLTAQRLDPAAAVTFEFNRDPRAGNGAAGWTAITDTSTTTGPYEDLAWEPPDELVGRTIALRAVAVTAGGTTYSLRRGVVDRRRRRPRAQRVARPQLLPVPVRRPRTTTSPRPGTSSSPTPATAAPPPPWRCRARRPRRSGSVALRWWRESDQTFRGRVDAAVTPHHAQGPRRRPAASSASTGGSFAGVLNIAPFAPDPGDVIAVSAERSTDDVLPTTLLQQTDRDRAGHRGQLRRCGPARPPG